MRGRTWAGVSLLVLALFGPSLVLLPAPVAGTLVPPQTITVDTVWTPAGNPYYILGTINVSAGVNLTLEPGVEVRVNPGPSANSTLRIYGNLSAVGTPASPILFLSNASTPSASDWNGLDLQEGAGATFSNVLIKHAFRGIRARSTGFVSISNMTVESSQTGILIEPWVAGGTSNVSLADSLFSSNAYGVRLYDVRSLTLAALQIRGNGWGLLLQTNANDNTVTQSSIYDNSVMGISVQNSFGNLFYNNTVVGNTVEASDDTNANSWDNGYPVGGNVWGNYTGNDTFSGLLQDQPGSDGFCDTPYWIDADSLDRYPRMAPAQNFPPLITLESPANGSLISSGTNVVVHVFDRDLSSAEYVEDNGLPIPFVSVAVISTAGWLDGIHNVTVTATDTSGWRTDRAYWFLLDSTPPVVTLVSPLNNSWVRPSVPILFSATDAHLSGVNLSIDGGPRNVSLSPHLVLTDAWPDGPHNVSVDASDGAGNTAHSVFAFTFDGTPPQLLNFTPPGNAVARPNTTVDLEFSEPMDRASVEQSLLFTVIAYDVQWSENDTHLRAIPLQPLAVGEVYVLRVGPSASDLAGNPIGETPVVRFTVAEEVVDTGPDASSLPMVALLVAGAAVLCIALFLLIRRKRPGEAKDEPAAAATETKGPEGSKEPTGGSSGKPESGTKSGRVGARRDESHLDSPASEDSRESTKE